jgi:hypothetical protein
MGRLLSFSTLLAMLLVAVITVPRNTAVSNFLSWVPPPKPFISPFADSILFAISIMATSILLCAAIRPSRRVLLKQISLLRDQVVSLRVALVKDQHWGVNVREAIRGRPAPTSR